MLAVAGLIVVGLATVRVKAALERRAEIGEIERARSRLAELRAGVENCQAAVERERQAFDRYAASVDSLRTEVRHFEALDERGVPAARYDEYLETFDRYNDAIPGWEARADSLTAHAEACRELTLHHNELADSLRVRLEAAGREPWAGPDRPEPRDIP